MAQCLDGSEYLVDAIKLPSNVDNVNRSVLPTQDVRQKLAKNRGWTICKSFTDIPNKRFIYDCFVNSESMTRRSISFQDACLDFNWKSFEFQMNGEEIKFEHDVAWENYLEKLSARLVKQAKKEKKNQKDKDNLVTELRK